MNGPAVNSIYVVGSLRNPRIPEVGNAIRATGREAFDSWYAAGPEADDYWKAYSKARGQSFGEALEDWAARHVFEFDKSHLLRCDAAVLVMPAGKSACLELGVAIGRRKPSWIVYPDGEPEDRWDCMFQFADRVFWSLESFVAFLKGEDNGNA